VFRITRHRAVTPSVDLSTVRETLLYMRDDARSVAGLERVAVALDAALDEVDAAEQRRQPAVPASPVASRFLPLRAKTIS
jgi:hypothetical protein